MIIIISKDIIHTKNIDKNIPVLLKVQFYLKPFKKVGCYSSRLYIECVENHPESLYILSNLDQNCIRLLNCKDEQLTK